MDFMAQTLARRADPRALWSEVASIIMLGVNYGPAVDPMEALGDRDRGIVSVYARNRDYHDVMKGRLKLLAGWLVSVNPAEVKVFVDTAPVMEKPLAAAAGLGWQGKHTNLVSREFGSWLFLGAIFTDLKLPPDAPEADHCGTCRACLDICPTQAFPAPYRLDARRRCIAYLTVEQEGPIAGGVPAKRSATGFHGCDDWSGGLPVEQIRQALARGQTDRARGSAKPPLLRRTRRARRAGVLAGGSPAVRSSASATRASCATC